MDLLAVLRTLRRHWVLILALTVVGGIVGAATGELSEKTEAAKTFHKATTTLVVDLTNTGNQSKSPFSSLDQVAIFVTTGDVPNQVAKTLGSDESGQELAEHITTTTNGSTSTIAITAAEPTAEEAEQLADTFATTLVAVLDQKAQQQYTDASNSLQTRLNDLDQRIGGLIGQIAANPPNAPQLKAQLQALQQQYSLAYDNFSQLAAQGPPTSRFSTLQKAQAVPIDKAEYDARLNLGATSRNNLTTDSTSSNSEDNPLVTTSSSSPVNGPVPRGILGAFLGLLAGIGLSFVIERLDRRVRTRAEAEEAFQLPVLAEVPQIKKAQQKDNEILASSAPLSRLAEAYRAVRSSLLFTRAAMAEHAAGQKGANGTTPGGTLFEPAHDEPLVVMVTSASPGEGKTTTTANLAAVFAEAGSSVLVVNCDFRRPTVHRFFGAEDEPRRVQETNVPNVKIVTNVLTDPASNPAQVVAAQRQVVAAARGRFDVILLDTAPLLTANDAVELVSSADLLLLVARMGVTKTDAAERSIELLNRLEVAIAGVVLVGATSASNDYYYYYQPGRVSVSGEPPQPKAAINGNGNGTAGPEMFLPEHESKPTSKTDATTDVSKSDPASNGEPSSKTDWKAR
jgi:Mrp family chromosome partitioning ATPase/capsular polysaccharide biosynthesis protein